MSSTPVTIGIDVAKAHLDVAVRPGGEQWQVPNDEAGIQALLARLQPLRPRLIVLEASGGWELLAASSLAGAGLPVAVVNPRQVRDFAKATGQLAKTDVLDAQVWRSLPSGCGRSPGRCRMTRCGAWMPC